jgi:hypothetical protein
MNFNGGASTESARSHSHSEGSNRNQWVPPKGCPLGTRMQVSFLDPSQTATEI